MQQPVAITAVDQAMAHNLYTNITEILENKPEWQRAVERELGRPLTLFEKQYMDKCMFDHGIENLGLKEATEHFLTLGTGGSVGYLVYLASHTIHDHVRDAAIKDLSQQFHVSEREM